jgi:hypothetical protein
MDEIRVLVFKTATPHSKEARVNTLIQHEVAFLSIPRQKINNLFVRFEHFCERNMLAAFFSLPLNLANLKLIYNILAFLPTGTDSDFRSGGKNYFFLREGEVK